MRFTIFCLVFFSWVNEVSGQNFEAGIETGYGKIYNLQEVFMPTSYKGVNNCSVGLCFSYSIPKSYFIQNMNIIFQRIGINSRSINFIQIPIGMDIVQGRKVQGIIGAGWIVSYLFYHSPDLYQDFINHHTDFQLGGYFNVGIKIHCDESWNVFLKGILETEFTTLYKVSIPNHFGKKYYSNHKSFGFSIHAGIKYTIKTKK